MSSVGPFLCYRELLSSNGISLSSFFSNDLGEYLVAVSNNLIQLYKVINYNRRGSNFASISSPQIILCLQYQIFGRIKDLKTYRPLDDQANLYQYIILTVDVGKILILQFRPYENELVQYKLHNVEDGAIGVGAEVQGNNYGRRLHPIFGDHQILAIDHHHNLICSLIYTNQLIFFPLYIPSKSSKSHITSSNEPFVIDVLNKLLLIGPIIDFCFLSHSSKPVLVILQEYSYLPIGHAAAVMHTNTVTFLAIDVTQRSAAILYQKDNLPHDSHRIYEFSYGIFNEDAVIVISTNGLVIITPSFSVAFATNGFASTTIHSSYRIQSWSGHEGIDLNASRWIVSNQYDNSEIFTMIASLSDGRLMAFHFHSYYMENHSSFHQLKLEHEVLAKSIPCGDFSCSMRGDLWLLGSVQCDSLMIYVHTSNEIFGQKDSFWANLSNFQMGSSSFPAMKRQRRLSKGDVSLIHHDDIDKEESLLFGSILQTNQLKLIGQHTDLKHHSERFVSIELKYLLQVVDIIPSMGPILNGFFTSRDDTMHPWQYLDWSSNHSHIKANHFHDHSKPIKDMKDSLLCAAGLDHHGSLTQITNGLNYQHIIHKEFLGATMIHTIAFESHSLLFLSFHDTTRLFSMSQLHTMNESVAKHRDIVQFLSSDIQLNEISGSDTGYMSSEPTIYVGKIDTDIIIQIFPKGIRVIRQLEDHLESEALQDILVAESLDIGGMGGCEDEMIHSGDMHNDWVIVLTSRKVVVLLRYNRNEECVTVVKCGSSHVYDHVNVENHDDVLINTEMNDKEFDQYLKDIPVSVTFYSGPLNLLEDSIASNDEPSHDNYDMDVAHTQGVESYHQLSTQEEAYLYDGDENESHHDGGADKKIITDVELDESMNTAVDNNEPSKLFLVIADCLNHVTILELDQSNASLRLVFKTNQFSLQSPRIDVWHEMKQMKTNSLISYLSDQNYHPDRILCHVRLVRLDPRDELKESYPSPICFVGLFDSGDVIIYYSVEIEGVIRQFHQLEHSNVTHRQKLVNTKLKRSLSCDNAKERSPRYDIEHDYPCSPRTSKVDQQFFTYDGLFNSFTVVWNDKQCGDHDACYHIEYHGCSSPWASHYLTNLASVQNQSGLLIPGIKPLALISFKAYPTLIQLGLPELPFSNTGLYVTASFKLADSCNGIVTLWQEDEGVLPRRMVSLYQEVPNQLIFPQSQIACKRLETKKTVNHCIEILPKTDDKTEQALLQRKTFLLACSEVLKTPFVPNVMTEEEIEFEEANYDRFFSDLTSFAQPDPSLGPAGELETQQHKLVLVQGGTAVDVFELPKNERILGVEAFYIEAYVPAPLPLNQQQPVQPTSTQYKRRVFVAACTSVIDKHGEDTQGEGRLLIFSVDYKLFDSDVNEMLKSAERNDDRSKPEDKGNGTKVNGSNGEMAHNVSDKRESQSAAQEQFLDTIQPKLKLHWEGPGPASVVKQLGPHLLSTVGSSMYIYKYNHDTSELDQISFYYAQFYISSVSVIKNFILITDVCNSVQFLVWREEDYSLTLLAKDFDRHICLSSSFLWDNSSLGMVIGDNEGNLQFLHYNPRKIESIQGSRLLGLSDFHLGHDANILLRHSLLAPNPAAQSIPTADVLKPKRKLIQPPTTSPFSFKMDKILYQRSCCIVGTMTGSVGVLIPIEEKIYRRLALLQQIMSMGIATPFAMNPKEYRKIKSKSFRIEKKSGILDGVLLWRYNTLPSSLQDELATIMGVTTDVLLDNLSKIDISANFF